MQQTTIGGDSDVGGSERPRRKAKRGPRPDRRARQHARAKQAAAPAMDDGGNDEVARRSDGDDSDRD